MRLLKPPFRVLIILFFATVSPDCLLSQNDEVRQKIETQLSKYIIFCESLLESNDDHDSEISRSNFLSLFSRPSVLIFNDFTPKDQNERVTTYLTPPQYIKKIREVWPKNIPEISVADENRRQLIWFCDPQNGEYEIVFRKFMKDPGLNISLDYYLKMTLDRDDNLRITKIEDTKRPIDKDGDFVIDSCDVNPKKRGLFTDRGSPDQDSDSDGLPDDQDHCPYIAGPPGAWGCPDNDGDLVPDIDTKSPENIDQCPNLPGLRIPGDCNGCPNRDGDALCDRLDDCPDESGPSRTKGCPDYDQDGIWDRIDECWREHGLEKFKGCPDSDEDGLPDKSDKCPEKKGPEYNNGCPLKPPSKWNIELNGSTAMPIALLGDKALLSTDFQDWSADKNLAGWGFSGSAGLDFTPLRFLGFGIGVGYTYLKFQQQELENSVGKILGIYQSNFIQTSASTPAFRQSWATVKLITGTFKDNFSFRIEPFLGIYFNGLFDNKLEIRTDYSPYSFDKSVIDFKSAPVLSFGANLAYIQNFEDGESPFSLSIFLSFMQAHLKTSPNVVTFRNNVPALDLTDPRLKIIQAGLGAFFRLEQN